MKLIIKINNEEFSIRKSFNCNDFYYLRTNFYHYGFFGSEISKGKIDSSLPYVVEEFHKNLNLYKLAYKKINNMKAFI